MLSNEIDLIFHIKKTKFIVFHILKEYMYKLSHSKKNNVDVQVPV